MREGGERVAVIRPEWGYGKKGMKTASIPPDCTFRIQVKLLRCLWRVCNKPTYAFFGNVSFFTSSFPSLSVYVNTLIADGMSDSSTKLGPSTLPLTALSLTHPSAFAAPVTEPGAAYTTPSLCSTTTFSSPYTTISAFSYAIIHNSHRLPFSQSSFGFPHSRRAAKRLPRQRSCTRQPPCRPDRSLHPSIHNGEDEQTRNRRRIAGSRRSDRCA